MADPQTRKLARQIVDIDRRLKGVERTPQLAHSSIDDGFLPVYDKDGNLTAKFGRQDDGTWGAPPLSGPVPSMPVGVTALGGPGMLSVSWTGEYESKAAPLDFDTLEILVDGVLAGAIPNRDGGTVSISAEEGTRYISARIRTLVPRHSPTISPFGVEVGPPADQLFAEARERIEDAEMSLGETQVRLEGAEQAVTEVRDGLDTLETVTLPSAVADLEAADQAAAQELATLDGKLNTLDGVVEGKPDFDDLTVGNLLAGSVSAPEAVIDKLFAETFAAHKITASELSIASVKPDGTLANNSVSAVTIKDGAITTPKLTVTEDMSAAIVNAMSVSTKKLIVTEETILNHATLIGQTVVDDINVQGKLIGTDGVFTGTVDFANVNVTGTQIVNKLGANSISADKIKGGDFTGKTFFGGAFYGGRFATSNEPFTDGGVQIDAQYGLRGWAAGSDWRDTTFQLSPVDGSVSISANLRALNSSNQGVVLVPQTGTHGNAALIFTDDGGLGAETAAIWRETYSGAREPLNIRGAHRGGVRIHDNLLVGGNIDGASYITAKGLASPKLYYYGSGGVTITGQDSTIYARNDSSGPQFAASAIPGRSAGGGANVYCTGFGTLARTSSSRRYKKEIEDWEPSVEKVLALQPRSWVPVNNEDDGSDATAHGRYVGFVAEEVQDVGLEDLVTYSLDENNDRQAEGLHYDRFAAAQQVVLVDHESRIKELEARIAELEGAGR